MARGLVRKNNLSDLPSPEQARINLGLATADANRIKGLFSSASVQPGDVQKIAGSAGNFQAQINSLNSTLSGIVPSLYVARSGDTVTSGWTNIGFIQPSFVVQSGTTLSGSTDSLFTVAASGLSYPLSTSTLTCNLGLTVQSFGDNGNVVFASGIAPNKKVPVKINGVQFFIEAGGDFSDADAIAYIAAVEAADGQTLEDDVKFAIHDFVAGCKADGIWNAIKASCILSGARTLAGALQPLVGTAPTNFNFVTGDYNRKTGLVGNGSTKYLNSNRQNAADSQNSRHQSVFLSTGQSVDSTVAYIAGGGLGYTGILRAQTTSNLTCYASNDVIGVTVSSQGSTTGLKGVARNNSSQISIRSGGVTTTASNTSAAENTTRNVAVFAQIYTSVSNYTNARLAFYSIGESLDLALLDARVSALITAFGVAIP